jgi:hypothetical protein
MGANQRQNSKVVKRCGLSVKKNETSQLLLDVFFNLKTHIMSQKKHDNLGQLQPPKDQSNVNYHKGSTVEFWRSRGIPSRNTTHEKLGQTSLMFTNRTKPLTKDDSLEASIRHLKYKKINP